MTQHQKIIEMCRDGLWHCQTEFWAISKSPHKRRDDIEQGRTKYAKKGEWEFTPRPCQHDIKASCDYKMEHPTFAFTMEKSALKPQYQPTPQDKLII